MQDYDQTIKEICDKYSIKYVRYADDQLLFLRNKDYKDVFLVINSELNRIGLNLNASKCKMFPIYKFSEYYLFEPLVLFECFSNTTETEELLKTTTCKEYSIPPAKKNLIATALQHDSKNIVPCFEATINIKKEKVRFDSKVDAAYKLGIISEKMKDDLINIYEYRNTIHIEVAIKKNLDYTLEVSKKAYRRVEGLNIELSNSLRKLGLFG